jgi:DNA transposition AAA+ family ATPase
MQKEQNDNFKQQVMEAVKLAISSDRPNAESQAGLAKRAGFAPSFITHVLGGPKKWANYSNGTAIPDYVFQRLAEALGLSQDVFPTENYQKIYSALAEAKLEQEYRIIDGGPGAGKTFACKDFVRQNPAGTYMLTCAGDLSAKELMQELAAIVGANPEGTKSQIRKSIEQKLARETDLCPLIIIDEAENLRDGVFDEIKAIHDTLEYRCGIVIVGANNFYKGLERKAMKGKGCFPQIFSRFKTNAVFVGSLSPADAVSICEAHGITEKAEIKRIYNLCQDHRDLFRHLRRREKDARLIMLDQTRKVANA